MELVGGDEASDRRELASELIILVFLIGVESDAEYIDISDE